jgi:hypothetical protein
MMFNAFARRRGVGIATGALVIVLAACGSQPDTVTVKKAVSPQKVVLASVRATAAAKSARMSMTVSTDATGAADIGLSADGVTDFATGDAEMEMRFSGPATKLFSGGIEMRVVDHTAYMKLPASLGSMFGNGKWLKIPNIGAADTTAPGAGETDPSKFLAYLETVSSNVTKVGTETIRGVETTHYQASLDLGKAADRADVPASLRDELRRLLGAKANSAIPADVWVDGNGLARRVKMTIELGVPTVAAPAGDPIKIAVSMDLYDFGVPVHVVAPPADQITVFPFGPSGATSASGTLGTPS